MTKQRFLAISLCAMLLVCLLPGAALAGDAKALYDLIYGSTEGDTLTLGQNYSGGLGASISIPVSMTIDLKGHAIQNIGLIVGDDKTVTIKSTATATATTERSKISMTNTNFYPLWVPSGATLTVDNVDITGVRTGIYMSGASLSLTNATVEGKTALAVYSASAARIALNNATLHLLPDGANPSRGIYLSDATTTPLTLTLAGASTISGVGAFTMPTAGIQAERPLTVTGGGALTVTAPASDANSNGVSVQGMLTVSGGATLTAKGGEVKASSLGSRGVSCTDMTVSGATVRAAGGDVKDGGGSYGLFVTSSFTATNADITTASGSATTLGATSAGLSCPSITLANASLNAIGGMADFLSTGVDGVLTLTNSSVIAQATTGGGRSAWALMEQPVINGAYRWRTADTDPYTDSATAPYVLSPQHRYVQILPIAPPVPPTPKTGDGFPLWAWLTLGAAALAGAAWLALRARKGKRNE